MLCTCPNCQTQFEHKQTRKKREVKETDSRVKTLILFYSSIFQYRYDYAPIIKFGATGSMMKTLLKTFSENEIETFITDYIAYQDDFYEKSGYSILLLPNFIQKQAVKSKSKPKWDGLL